MDIQSNTEEKKWDIIHPPTYDAAISYLEDLGVTVKVTRNEDTYRIVLNSETEEFSQTCSYSAGYSPTAIMEFFKKIGDFDSKDWKKILAAIKAIVEYKIPSNHGLSNEQLEEAFSKELDIEDLEKILGYTIKRDNYNKVITFLAFLSAYTEDSQFNISFKSESSTGKSYIPIEISNLFPKEDIIEIAYASPSSFFHELGEYDEETREYIINLEHKIIIFLDMPDDQLLMRLRPVLSHDRKKLHYKITDRGKKGRLRTKKITIIGYPTVVFCTAKLVTNDQEATRQLLLSPEISQEKIREALYLKAKKEANKEEFLKELNSIPERQMLKNRIIAIKLARINNIIIPKDLWESIFNFFNEDEPLKPRYTRDVGRLINITKALALLNYKFRERQGRNIIASDEDVYRAFKLYEDLWKSQRLGLSPYVYDLYEEVIRPKCIELGRGIRMNELAIFYYEKYGRLMEGTRMRREILPSLMSVGLINYEPDPNDKRYKVINIVPTDGEMEGGTTPPRVYISGQLTVKEVYNQVKSIRKTAEILGLSRSKVWRELKGNGKTKYKVKNNNEEDKEADVKVGKWCEKSCYNCVHSKRNFCLLHKIYITPSTPICDDYAEKPKAETPL